MRQPSAQQRLRRVSRIALVGFLSVLQQQVAQAVSYVDALDRIRLSVTPVASSTERHVAWRFSLVPLDQFSEISSIDAATGGNGFFSERLRQVNPSGLPTVFSDYNAFFPAGDDATTDTQFTFARSGLTVVSDSASEGNDHLTGAFTGFDPITSSTGGAQFAQVVMPDDASGQFSAAVTLRQIGGGIPQLVQVGPINFGGLPGDFNADGVVDAADYTVWRDDLGLVPSAGGAGSVGYAEADRFAWKSNFGSRDTGAITVPEPSGLVIIAGATALSPRSRRSRKLNVVTTHAP